MPFVTNVVEFRLNNHDAARLAAVRLRWGFHYRTAHRELGQQQGAVALKCLELWRSKDGQREQLVVNSRKLQELLTRTVPNPVGLNSSAKVSLINALQEQWGSWLGLYAAWVNGGRKGPKPALPSVAPSSLEAAARRWDTALTASEQVATLDAENEWRAEVTRSARMRYLPVQFAAAMSGVEGREAHCGILRREDGRYFALLTVLPQGDRLGAGTTRASNRQDRGQVFPINDTWERKEEQHGRAVRKALRNEQPEPEAPNRDAWTPTPYESSERRRCSIMVPLMFGNRAERLYFELGTPKSAEIVWKDGRCSLHIAVSLPERTREPLPGRVLAIRRGITTLAAATVLDAQGRVLAQQSFTDKGLARTITANLHRRAVRQAKGKLTTGDRRNAAITEETLYLLAHDILRLADTQQVSQIVLLKDPDSRKPTRMLAWKHWSAMHDILRSCAARGGFPEPQERMIRGTGSWSTCAECGWMPGDPVRHENAAEGECPGCRATRDREYHLSRLLALDATRDKERYPRLGDWVRYLKTVA